MRRILGHRFNAELESVYTRAFSYVVTILGRTFDAGTIDRKISSSTDDHLCAGSHSESSSTYDFDSDTNSNSNSNCPKCPVSKSNLVVCTMKGSQEKLGGEKGMDQLSICNGSPKSSLRDKIHPPPLTAKEIYRLKTTWSTKFESYGSMKEAGIDTIIRFNLIIDFMNYFWKYKSVMK